MSLADIRHAYIKRVVRVTGFFISYNQLFLFCYSYFDSCIFFMNMNDNTCGVLFGMVFRIKLCIYKNNDQRGAKEEQFLMKEIKISIEMKLECLFIQKVISYSFSLSFAPDSSFSTLL